MILIKFYIEHEDACNGHDPDDLTRESNDDPGDESCQGHFRSIVEWMNEHPDGIVLIERE